MITTIANTIHEYLSAEGYIVSQGRNVKMLGKHPDIITYIRTMHYVWCCTIIYSEQGLTLVPATWCTATSEDRPSTYADKVIEYAHPDLIETLILTINNYNLAQQNSQTWNLQN